MTSEEKLKAFKEKKKILARIKANIKEVKLSESEELKYKYFRFIDFQAKANWLKYQSKRIAGLEETINKAANKLYISPA